MTEGSVWFRAAIGRRKNAEARWLLPMICRRGGIEKQDIGAIRILDTTTEFEISERVAESFAVKVQRPDKEDNIRIEALAAAPQGQAASEKPLHAPGPRQNDKFHSERAPNQHGKPRHQSEPGFGKPPAFKKKKRSRDNPAPGNPARQAAMANGPARPAFGNKAKKNRRG
jgi:ATP-dependent RNA helicase DeaD